MLGILQRFILSHSRRGGSHPVQSSVTADFTCNQATSKFTPSVVANSLAGYRRQTDYNHATLQIGRLQLFQRPVAGQNILTACKSEGRIQSGLQIL